MTAQQKVSNDQVREAMEAWKGNVSAAAASIGIHPKNLRERLRRMGLTPETFRHVAKRTGTYRHVVAPMERHGVVRGAARAAGASTYGPKNQAGTFSKPKGTPTLANMQAAAKEIEDDAGPIRTIAPRPKPLRLRPEQQERLDAARLEYIARYRREPEHSALLQQYFDDGFEAWFARILGPVAAAPTNGKKKADR